MGERERADGQQCVEWEEALERIFFMAAHLMEGELRAGIEEAGGQRDQFNAGQAFAEGIQDERHARKTQHEAEDGSHSEGDSQKQAREDRAEEGTGIAEQHSDQERAVCKIVKEAELRDEHRAHPQPVQTSDVTERLRCACAQDQENHER